MNFTKRLTLLTVSGLLISPIANAQENRTKTRLQALQPSIGQAPSSADVVNKLLNPGPSDPNVPLPQSGLDRPIPEDPALQSPALYGRKEENGALLGVRVPLPGARGASATR
jgi:hypothetical protein